MQIETATVWCGITKKALLGYSRFTELPSTIHISHGNDGVLRMVALLENKADNIEFGLKFSSSDEMRRVARIFNAMAELRDSLATPNAEVRGASRLAGEASSREAATSTAGLEGGEK